MIRVNKRENSIIRTLKEMFLEESEQKDWRDEIKGKIGRLEHGGSIKELKNYTLIEGELYGRLFGGSCLDVLMRRKGS